jgi:hypothetical protein
MPSLDPPTGPPAEPTPSRVRESAERRPEKTTIPQSHWAAIETVVRQSTREELAHLLNIIAARVRR